MDDVPPEKNASALFGAGNRSTKLASCIVTVDGGLSDSNLHISSALGRRVRRSSWRPSLFVGNRRGPHRWIDVDCSINESGNEFLPAKIEESISILNFFPPNRR
jgi:hypothetical protein